MKRFNNIQPRKILRNLGLLAILWFTAQAVSIGSAQTANQNWSDPFNISRSGSANRPAAVAAPDGTVHVLWRDEYTGIMHSQSDEEGWSEPVELAYAMDNVTLQLIDRLPESLSTRMIELDSPTLHADQNGLVHAFWQTPDAELFHNQVPIGEVSIRQRWSQARLMSEDVVAFDLFEDDQGNLHLVFVSNTFDGDNPAGVYYRRWNERTRNWQDADPLFQSQYFRKLNAQTANVSISGEQVDDESLLYVVWDDETRLRTYLARSLDGGSTWDPPGTLSSPENNIISPKNAQVVANDEQVLVLWQEGDNAQLGCTQRFLLSADRGRSWDGPINLFEENTFCPDKITPFTSPDAPPFFFVILQNRPYLVAWDGRAWGELTSLSGLTGLFDPETRQPIQLGCQSAVRAETAMFFVGCDQVSGDIWVRWREFSSVSELFPAESAWASAAEIFAGGADGISNPLLKADSENAFHAFWIYHSSDTDESDSSIYYARLQEDRWTSPVELFPNVNAKVDQPLAVEVTPDGRFLLVWSSGTTGEIFFSWASTTRAYLRTEWAEPVQVAEEAFSQSPGIIIDQDGNLRIAYSVAINEARGVYTVVSEDNGRNWSSPEQIFDGVDAGWDIVGFSRFVGTENGDYALLLQRFYDPFDLSKASLYFGLNFGSGIEFADLENLSGESDAGWRIANGELFTVSSAAYHRLWLDKTDPADPRVWHQVSPDQGLSWPSSLSVRLQGMTIEDMDAAVNPAGEPQMLIISSTPMQTEWHLTHWYWDNDQWQSGEDVVRMRHRIVSLASAFAGTDQLGVLYLEEAGRTPESESSVLWFSMGDVKPSGPAVTQPGLTEQPAPGAATEVDTTADSDADEANAENPVNFADIPSTEAEFNILGLDAAVAGPVIGGVLAVTIILIAFVRFRMKSMPRNGKYR